MADYPEKKYLDLAGLQRYDALIKAYIKTNGSDVTDKLVALIGAAEKGADEKTILARIADLEAAVGDVSELEEGVANLVKAVIGEVTRAKAAEKANADAIEALDEKLYGSDAESEGETVHTKGDIDKIEDRLDALEGFNEEHTLNYYSEDAEKKSAAIKTGADATAQFSINGTDVELKSALPEAFGGNVSSSINVNGFGIKEGVVYGDTEISTSYLPGIYQLSAEDKTKTASNRVTFQIGSDGAHMNVASDAKFTYNSIEVATVNDVAAEETARKAQIGELGKVSEEADAADHTVKSYVDAAVEAINGDAEALEDRVEAVEALHAKKTVGEGEDAEEVFKTVAEEVNEAVVALVDGAPEALDTLKEIADWIAEQGEADEDGAAQLVSKIEKNAKAIEDEEKRAEAAEEELQKQIDAFTTITDSEIDALFGEPIEDAEEGTF